MEIVDRLKLFMDQLNLSSSQFADAASIPRPTLSQIITGRNKKVSNEIFTKLHNAFPQLNIMWLMFGDGQMVSKNLSNKCDINFQTNNNADNSYNLFDLNMSDGDYTSDISAAHNSSGLNSAKAQTNVITPIDKIAKNNFLTEDICDTCSDAGQSKQIPLSYSQNRPSTQSKNILSIMVFYDDNSFETFYPSKQ